MSDNKRCIYYQGTAYWWNADKAVNTTLMVGFHEILKTRDIKSMVVVTSSGSFHVEVEEEKVILEYIKRDQI